MYISTPVLYIALIFLFLLSLYYLLFRRKPVSLYGKTVVITGASSGLGEAFAEAFYRHGCRVVLCARRKDELLRVSNYLTSFKLPFQKPLVVVMDMADGESIQNALDTILVSCSSIDVLINNAGISGNGSVVNTTIEVHRKIMEVNYFGVITLTKAVMKHMIDKGVSGSMVAISSIQGRISIPYRSQYGSTKHALQSFCDTLRAEVAKHNIHIGVASPGYTRTQISVNSFRGDGSICGKMSKNLETGMTPEYVADHVVNMVKYRTNETLIGPLYVKIGVYARTLCPWVLFKYMENMAAKVEEFE